MTNIQPINHGASMAFMPAYFVVKGYFGETSEHKVEFMPCDKVNFDPDVARMKFYQTYYTAGIVRGVTVTPLYDLNRYH